MIKRVATPMKKRTLYYGNFQNSETDSCTGTLIFRKIHYKNKKRSVIYTFFW